MKRFVVACALCAVAMWGFVSCDDRSVGPPSVRELSALIIDRPPFAAGEPQYAKVIRFGWSALEGAAPVAIRHLWSPVVDSNGTYDPAFDIVKDLNDNPARYEAEWTKWIPFDAPGDSGRTTVLGDDETLQLGRYHIFAVQARDASGKMTTLFDRTTNVRRFRITTSAIPLLFILEERLVGFRFLGTVMNVERRDLPPGTALRFTWRADASSYSGEIAGYRFAWDLPDVNRWDAPFRPELTGAPEVTFYAGAHTLFVETLDIAGGNSLARVTVNVIPFPMDRALLFVDDYYSSAAQPGDYSNPGEAAHDAFWLDICSRAAGFEPARDVYDCVQNQLRVPGPDLIGRYRNIIWTHSSENNIWGKMIYFTPESQVGRTSRYPVNYLSLYLLKGGHLWTLGQSQRGGGLAAALAPGARMFPVDLRCEITGNRDDCAGDRSGVNSMPYRDYCVTMIDKVEGVFRSTSGMPARSRDHYDCMTYASRADADPITAAHPGLPERLDLWEEVAKSGRYFNPEDSLGPGGLTYVEAYDPAYWMERSAVLSQTCFHPLYRMRSKSESSALDGCPVALWVTKYDDVVPDVVAGGGVAAPSLHFGFPLWFFKRDAVDSVVSVVFDEWGIAR